MAPGEDPKLSIPRNYFNPKFENAAAVTRTATYPDGTFVRLGTYLNNRYYYSLKLNPDINSPEDFIKVPTSTLRKQTYLFDESLHNYFRGAGHIEIAKYLGIYKEGDDDDASYLNLLAWATRGCK